MKYLAIIVGGLAALLIGWMIGAGGLMSYILFLLIGLVAGYLVQSGILKGERSYWLLLLTVVILLALNFTVLGINRYLLVAPIVAMIAMAGSGLVKRFQNT